MRNVRVNAYIYGVTPTELFILADHDREFNASIRNAYADGP